MEVDCVVLVQNTLINMRAVVLYKPQIRFSNK